MKKHFCRLLLFGLFIILLDFIGYLVVLKNSLDMIPPENRKEAHFPSWFQDRFRMYDETTIKYFEKQGKFREPSGVEEYKDKKAIWLFGCSFVYGVDLMRGELYPNEETFSYILSNITKRPVYNFAYPSWGIQHMYYHLEKGDIFKDAIEPEYVIYTFISDHVRRTQKIIYDPWSDGEYLRYKYQNGKLNKINAFFPVLWKLYPVKLWLNHLEYKIRLDEKNHDDNFDLVKTYFIESQKILKQHYPNVKFIILKYNGNDGFDRWFIENDRWNELSDNFIVIDADKLINKNLKDKEYLGMDNYHPNNKAWEEISDKLKDLL